MHIYSVAVALAVGLGVAISWTICSLLVAVVPGPAMPMTGSMFHLPTEAMGWHLTGGGFLAGLISWSLGGALFAWLCSELYNVLSRPPAQG